MLQTLPPVAILVIILVRVRANPLLQKFVPLLLEGQKHVASQKNECCTCCCHPYAGDHPPPLASRTLASLYTGGSLADSPSLQLRTVQNILPSR